MDRRNCSSITEFIFLGITDNAVNKVILLTIFLLVYLITLLANLGMITLIRMDPQLHRPMYFFLSHLSFSNLSISTPVGPKMLVDLFAKNKSIPFYGCALQLLMLYTFIDCECLLLAVMTYDWYKAVSSPLLYAVSMSSRVCSLLVAGVYLVSIAETLIHTTLAFRLCFCGSNEINHFFWRCCSSFIDILLRYRGQCVTDIYCFWLHWTEYHFRSSCLLLLYYTISLEDPLCQSVAGKGTPSRVRNWALV